MRVPLAIRKDVLYCASRFLLLLLCVDTRNTHFFLFKKAYWNLVFLTAYIVFYSLTAGPKKEKNKNVQPADTFLFSLFCHRNANYPRVGRFFWVWSRALLNRFWAVYGDVFFNHSANTTITVLDPFKYCIFIIFHIYWLWIKEEESTTYIDIGLITNYTTSSLPPFGAAYIGHQNKISGISRKNIIQNYVKNIFLDLFNIFRR